MDFQIKSLTTLQLYKLYGWTIKFLCIKYRLGELCSNVDLLLATLRRDSTEESLNNNNEKGLKDILLSFLKRRPMQETLVNKGIYKGKLYLSEPTACLNR